MVNMDNELYWLPASNHKPQAVYLADYLTMGYQSTFDNHPPHNQPSPQSPSQQLTLTAVGKMFKTRTIGMSENLRLE